MAKRTLEIFGRLGLGRRMLDKGVTWNTGRVFLGDRELFAFDLLPEDGHEYPAFINLQQYYAEEWLVEACEATGLVDLRWRHAVTGVTRARPAPTLAVDTPGRPLRSSPPTGCSPRTARAARCAAPWTCPSPAGCSTTAS